MPSDLISAIRDRVFQLLGVEVVEATLLPGSVANVDHRMQLADGRRVLVKVGPESELVAEAWSCRHLIGLGLPVAGVVALETASARSGTAVLITEFLSGGPSDDPAVLRQAGEMLRRVHTVQLSGWGPLVVRPDGTAHGRHGSSSQAVADQLAGLPALVADGVLGADTAVIARDLVLVPEILDHPGPGVLLHLDLKPAHLFAVDDGSGPRLTGVIDWGDACVGDPRADLARLSMAGPDASEAFCDGYGLDLTPELEEVLARYRILWNLSALAYEHHAGGDWFEVYR